MKKPKAEEKKPRKKRDANHARQRSEPTQIEEHRLVSCPDCHLRLGGISLSRSKEVKALYDQAVTWAEHGPDPNLSPRKQSLARAAQQHAFEQQLWQLCQPYAHTAVPQHILCERVERFLPELFVFVALLGVPAHNNLAERSIRPLVIARKISGGSRSPKGSQTRMGLASLFGTWVALQLNPFHQCLTALATKSSLAQV